MFLGLSFLVWRMGSRQVPPAKAFCPRSQDAFPGHLERGGKGCFSCLILSFREARGQCCHVCVGGWQDGDHPTKFSHPQPTAWWGEQESLGPLTINLRGARRRPGPRCILGRRRAAQDGRVPQPGPLTLTSESLKEEKRPFVFQRQEAVWLGST